MKSKKKSRSYKKTPSNVTRADIEFKLKEIDDIVSEATSSAADKAKVALGIGIAIALVIAFGAGRRRALRPKTLITFTKAR